MTAMYSIKGSAIRMKFEFVRNRFGPQAEEAMRSHFQGRPELSPLLDTSWVPFKLYEEINQFIAENHYGGDLSGLRDVGVYSAERGLASTYRVWVRGKQFVEFLEQYNSYYPTFYSHGRLEVSIGPERRSADLVFRDAPEYTQAELHIAAGYFLGACRVMGLEGVRHRASLASSGMEIRLRWS